jgi:hypothetical protein
MPKPYSDDLRERVIEAVVAGALEGHVEWLLALVAEQPDLTLDEIVVAMRKQRIPGSRTAVWRFFERHNVTVKKKPARDGARTGGRGAGTAADSYPPMIRSSPECWRELICSIHRCCGMSSMP